MAPNPWATHHTPAPAGLPRQAALWLAGGAALGLCLLAGSDALERRASWPSAAPAGGSPRDPVALTLDADAQRAMGLTVQTAFAVPPGPDGLPMLLVPSSGVVRESLGQAHVWVALGATRFARRQVTPLAYAEGSGRIAVTGALAPGESVVTHGALFLDAGTGR